MHLKAIDIKERLLGPDDYEVALSVGHLASLYNYDMNKFQEAERLYMRSINIGEGTALDKSSIMKRYHRQRTCSHTSPRHLPTMVTLYDTRFVECRWWNCGWTAKTVVGLHDAGPSCSFLLLAALDYEHPSDTQVILSKSLNRLC